MIKKWWFWVGILIVAILVWQRFTGWSASSKLYNQMLDNLRIDKSNIVKMKQDWIEGCETEISQLLREKEKLQNEKTEIQKEAAVSAFELARLKGEADELRKTLQNIAVSDDPDALIFDLRRRGLESIRRRSGTH